jgi:glycerol-3-phosphate dehydrogenase
MGEAAPDLGREIAPQLYEAELDYLYDQEWAHTADAVLWRRSKLGLRYDAAETAAVEAWFSERRTTAPRS